jgi:multidrug resistance efflux pump
MGDTLAPTDVVPAFRSDLTLSEAVKVPGDSIVVVTDPASGKSIALRGFELSLARMLDGHRTAAALVGAAKTIGLPISLEALTMFVRQLRAAGLLAAGGEGTRTKSTTWPQRAEWRDDVRARYQVALNEARSDRLSEAKQHLEALERDVPENSEVRELQAWVDQRLQAGPGSEALSHFPDVFDAVERSWFEEGERESQPDGSSSADLLDDARSPAKRSRRRGWLAVGGVLVLAGAALLVPWPYAAKGSFELTARNTVTVKVSKAGTVGNVSVSDGQWVQAGQPLFTYDTRMATAHLAEAERRAGELRRALDELRTGSAEPAQQVETAHASVAAARAELDAARAGHKRTAIAKAQLQLKKAEEAAAKAEQSAASHRAASETAAGGSEAELEAKLTAALADRDTQRALSEVPPVTATAEGFVAELGIKPGAGVKEGAPVCSLVDSKVLVVTMKVGGDDALSTGQTASLAIGGQDIAVKIESVEHGEGRGRLDNANGTLRASSRGELTIDGGRRSLLKRWF